MRNHRKQTMLFLAVVCVLGFSVSAEAVSLGDFDSQPLIGASMRLEKASTAIENVLPTPRVNSSDFLDAISVSTAHKLIRKHIAKPNVPDFGRAVIIPIPTTWDDAIVMPIPTQWDARIIFVSAE